MGNKVEKPLEIVTVHKPLIIKEESDHLEKLISQISIDSPILQGPSEILNNSEKFLNYFIPLHRYKAGSRLKDQENIMKKCQDIEKKSLATLSNNSHRYTVMIIQLIGNQLKKHQLIDEMQLIKIAFDEINEDIHKIETVLKKIENLDIHH